MTDSLADALDRAPAERPGIPEGCGDPGSEDGGPAWIRANERLERALTYWVCTVRPDGRPHVVPVWGIWLDEVFYFGGNSATRRNRNLAANPGVAVHIELGDDLVILEGSAEELTDPDRALRERLAAASAAKYHYEPDPDAWGAEGVFALRPSSVLAWSNFPAGLTRWKLR